ncbi:EAL domain-containing protein, partial [Pantoea sp. ME81]
IIEIGKWVMERTLQQMSDWDRMYHLSNLMFSINISPLQLMHRDFTQDTLLTLSHHKISPERLKFEITETTFIYDQKRISSVIEHFSQLGIKWAIDDFGVGYSSLKSISDFAIDDIKIDKSLIMHIFDNESAAIVVHKTIELSREMGLNVLAEGIESEEYFDYLRDKGCNLFQGYHFARPLPAGEAALWIRKATT